MGTRHLVSVVKDGEFKIAQYGQWDGYPSGQGVTVLAFLKNKKRVAKLKKSLDRVRFLDHEGRDKQFVEDHDSKAPKYMSSTDERTIEQKNWYNAFICRDIGADILENIMDSIGEVLLNDNSSFATESDCEWEYKISFDCNLLGVYESGKVVGAYNLNYLPTKKQFLKELGE